MIVNGINNELILAARLLLATLFLIFGWRKLRDFSGTVSQMVQLGVRDVGRALRQIERASKELQRRRLRTGPDHRPVSRRYRKPHLVA